MKDLVLSELRKIYTVTERDTGEYHLLKKSGMQFTIYAYEIKDFGSMSVIDMTAMFGLMKMESFILTAETRDLPLFSGDFIKAMSKCTLLEEFYDTMLEPIPEADQAVYREVKAKYADLPLYSTEPHWYDSIRYDFTLGATGKRLKNMKETITADYLAAYLKHAAHAPVTDPVQKKAKTKAYVDGLFANGGPAVNQFKKLFGEAAAREIFEKFVFSCR